MTAERDSMTLNEVSAPALGVEERSDEAPRAGRARPTPDPEVVAKPKRRQFHRRVSACGFWRRRNRCTQPGEVGRLLRREGLYSSHLTAWRKARRKGSLRELAAKKRGAKPAERNPLDAKLRALEAQVARLEHELPHRAHDPGRAGKSCRAAGIEPRTRNALLIAVQPLAAQVGVAPACQALGVSRASFYRRQRSTPGHQQPRPTPARALCEAEREQILDVLAGPALRRPCAGGGRGDAARRRPLPVLGADDVSDPGRRSAGPRAAQSARASPVHQARAGGHGAEPDLVLGHHQAVGADQVDVLLPLRRARHLQPLRGRLDGRRPGETRRWPVVSSKRPATNRASSPRCSPCTPTAARR